MTQPGSVTPAGPGLTPRLRMLLGAASLIIIIWGVKAIAPLLDTFLLALLLAMSFSPLMAWLRKRMSATLAVLVTVLVAVAGGLAVITLLGTSIAQLVDRLPTYQVGLTTVRDQLLGFLAQRGFDADRLRGLPMFDPGNVVSFAGRFLSGVAGALGSALIVILIMVLFLAEMVTREQGHSHFDEATRDVVKFVGMTGITGLMSGVAITIALLLMGVDFAVTWGVLYFFFNFVPAVGNLLALAPAATVAFLEHGWQRAVLVVVVFVVGNFIGDNILKPVFMKQGFDISLLAIVASLMFWNWVLGPAGMILAVPLTLTLKRVAGNYTEELTRAVTG